MKVEIEGVKEFKCGNLVRLAWIDEERGFGQIDIFQDEEILIDSECMSREFVKQVLSCLVDQARLKCEEQ